MKISVLILALLLTTQAQANESLITVNSLPLPSYACANEPLPGIRLCPDSQYAKELAADCKAADEALDRALDHLIWNAEAQLPSSDMRQISALIELRSALTARLKLNCAGPQ